MKAIQGGIPIAIERASFASASISSFANSMLMGGVHITKGNEPYTMTMRTVKGIGGNFSRTTTGALAFGAVSGGAGARLAGGIPIAIGRQGAVTGLIVSGLNHALHDGDGGGDPKKKKVLTTQEKIGKFVDGLDVSTSTKEALLSLADPKYISKLYLKFLNIMGKGIGAYTLYDSFQTYLNSPTTGNFFKFQFELSSFSISGVVSGGTALTFTNLGIGLLDATGISSTFFNYLGSNMDNITGFSLGKINYSLYKTALQYVTQD